MCSVLAAEWIIITTGIWTFMWHSHKSVLAVLFWLDILLSVSIMKSSPSITRRWRRSNWVLWSSTRGTWWRGREVQGSGSKAVIAWVHITGELTPRPFLVGVASAGEALRALQCLSKTPLAEPRPRRAVEVSVVLYHYLMLFTCLFFHDCAHELPRVPRL